MAQKNEKAEKLLRDAEKEMKRFFSSNENKHNKAADMCVHAGNLYKIDRNFESAAECFMKAAKHFEAVGSTGVAADRARDATVLYFKVPSAQEKALKALDYTQELLSDKGDPYKTARLLMDSGNIFNSSGAKDLAMKCYQRALDVLKDSTDSDTTKAKLIEEQAYIVSEQDINTAADYFFESAKIRIQKQLTQAVANTLFINAALCKLAANDVVGAKVIWDKAIYESPALKRSMDGEVIDSFVTGAQEGKKDVMQDAYERYSKMYALSAWTQNIFSTILNRDEKVEEEDADIL